MCEGKRKKELDNRNKNIPCFLCKKVFKSSTEFTTHSCICRKNVIEDVPKSKKILLLFTPMVLKEEMNINIPQRNSNVSYVTMYLRPHSTLINT